MNRKRSNDSHTAVRRASANATPGSEPEPEITAAISALLNGYKEESELYAQLRRLTWSQHDTLHGGGDLDRFRDLLEEKEDILRMIGQIESGMRTAKRLALSHGPSQSPVRRNLERMLDRLTETIEEIRIVEGANASLLEAVPAQ